MQQTEQASKEELSREKITIKSKRTRNSPSNDEECRIDRGWEGTPFFSLVSFFPFFQTTSSSKRLGAQECAGQTGQSVLFVTFLFGWIQKAGGPTQGRPRESVSIGETKTRILILIWKPEGWAKTNKQRSNMGEEGIELVMFVKMSKTSQTSTQVESKTGPIEKKNPNPCGNNVDRLFSS